MPQFPGGPVDLEPPIVPVEGNELTGLFEPLADFANSIGYTVAIEEIPGSALGYCSPERQHIAVEPISEEFSANAQIGVEIHELAHALVRRDRREEDPDLTYDSEEVVVECVSHSVCSSVGLDTSGWSVPCMASWGGGAEIARYAELIDRLARKLENAVLASGASAAEGETIAP